MSFRELAEKIAEAIAGLDAVKETANVTALVEDKGDVYAQVQKALNTGVAAVVAVTSHTRRTGAGASTSGTLDLEIDVSERARLNRANHPAGLTAQGAAEAIAIGLHRRALDGYGTLVYDNLRREDYEENGAAVARLVVALHLEQALTADNALAWGLEDGTQAFGEISSLTVRDAGEVAVEANRRGDDAFMGVRNRHLEIDVTANVTAGDLADAPAVGGTFTCPAYGETRTFTCTGSETARDAEDVATIHLTGRTFPSTTE